MNEKLNLNDEKKTSIFSNPLVLTLTALLCCLLWGSATPAIKTASALLIHEPSVFSTILFAGIRFTFAGILTVVIYSIARKRLLYPKLVNIPRVLCVSAFQTVIQYVFFYVGLTYTTGVKGTVASGTAAFFTVIVASLIFKLESITARKIIACVIGFAGIVIINLKGLDLTMNLLGDGFVIFSALSLSISSVLIKKFSSHEDPVVISGYQFIVGGIFLTLVGVLFGGKISFDSTTGVWLLVYLSALSAVAYSLWGVLLKHNPASKVSVFSFTTPIFGSLLSLLLLPEASGVDTLNLIFALVFVSLGIFLLNYQGKIKK